MADIVLAPTKAKPQLREATTWDQIKHNRNWLGFWFMLPAMAFLIFFLAYPLGLGIWLSFTDTKIGRVGQFISYENYEWLWDDAIFWLSVTNTLLYTFRVVLTGIHLMRSGEVQAHLPTLLGEVDAPAYLPELIEAKARQEHADADVEHARVRADVERLHAVLDEAQQASWLPDAPTVYDALHDLVVRVRLEG